MNIAVLISGNGSNLQALIDDQLNYKIKLVISNKSNAYGLQRAQLANIPTKVIPYKKSMTREQYDQLLCDAIGPIDLIVCAGFLRILTPIIINKYTIINLHPALSNSYIGLNAIERAYADFQKHKINHTGVMVHYVSTQVDRGQVITQQVIPIFPHDALSTLEQRIHQTEHKLLVQVVQTLANQFI